MTSQEAIDVLKPPIESEVYVNLHPVFSEALRMAINALEQVAEIQELNSKILDTKISYEQLGYEHELNTLVNGII